MVPVPTATAHVTAAARRPFWVMSIRTSAKTRCTSLQATQRASQIRCHLSVQQPRLTHLYGIASAPASQEVFALFGDFEGFVDFWLLGDLVADDHASVRSFMPFNNFQAPHVPVDIDSHRKFRASSIDFIQARNERIER